MANSKINTMNIFNNNKHFVKDNRMLESIKNQKENENPLIKRMDAVTFNDLKALKDTLKNKDVLKVYEIERIINNPPSTAKEPMEKFINEEIPMMAFVEPEVNDPQIQKNAHATIMMSFAEEDQDESVNKKEKQNELMYKFNLKSKTYKGFENGTFKTFVENKIIKKNKITITQRFNKFKLNFYKYILTLLNKFYKFIYLQTLSKDQRESLKNMDFEPNSPNNSKIVQLILRKNFSMKELKNKVKSFEKAIDNQDNHLLFE